MVNHRVCSKHSLEISFKVSEWDTGAIKDFNGDRIYKNAWFR